MQGLAWECVLLAVGIARKRKLPTHQVMPVRASVSIALSSRHGYGPLQMIKLFGLGVLYFSDGMNIMDMSESSPR